MDNVEDVYDEVHPLNPSLYYALCQLFKGAGGVRISNEGQVTQFKLTKHPFKEGVIREDAIQSGEYYRVCCPQCRDRRHRLYVNYRWNTVDSFGRQQGYRWMACCYNESCDTAWLSSALTGYVTQRCTIKHSGNYTRPGAALKEVTLPGTCVPLGVLGPDHPARKYIAERRFDWQELATEWGVCYCADAPADPKGRIPGTVIHAELVRNRLVIPIMWEGKLVGWQARKLGGTSRIKYYTMPGLHRNFMLFNGDRARTHNMGIVVEGVFDAFRVGPRAVALLGKSMSFRQRELAQQWWGSGALALMLDQDAIEDMERLQDRILESGNFRHGAFSILLPQDTDPADLSREELWSIVASSARARGIQLASV